MDLEMSESRAEGANDGVNGDQASNEMANTFYRLNSQLTGQFHLSPVEAAVKALELLQAGPPYIVDGVDITSTVVGVGTSGGIPPAMDSAKPESEDPEHPETELRTQEDDVTMEDAPAHPQPQETVTPSSSVASPANPPSASTQGTAREHGQGLDLSSIKEMVEVAGSLDDFKALRERVYAVFSSTEALSVSFLSSPTLSPPNSVDLDAAHEAFSLLISLGNESILNSLKYALESLMASLQYRKFEEDDENGVNQLLIVMEYPLLLDPSYHRHVLGVLVAILFHLPSKLKEQVKMLWSHSKERFERILSTLQQFITVRIYTLQGSGLDFAQPDVMCAASMIGILHEINAEKHYISSADFYNDAVNSEMNVVQDYKKWRTRELENLTSSNTPSHLSALTSDQLAFSDFPFMLDAAVKAKILQLDARIQMRAELQDAMLRTLLLGRSSPYLFLRVRRDNIIQDTLQQIASISAENKNDLKKPLKVQFVDEEGVDEGGVQKEFFQILIRQLLDLDYAMFMYDEETRTLWFNSHSLESSMEFELIGILMGIAIYNGVILDVNFPPTLYKLLLGGKPSVEDLMDCKPSLGRGLKSLLEYDGDVAETFGLTFQIQQEVFGEKFDVDLKENGADIPVTKENRQEFVELYVEYIFQRSVEKQYKAFHQGFHLVAGGDILKMFVPEELELLICGSSDLDFEALEKVTHYEDGYNQDSQCIKWFWSVVHEMTMEEKKKLLAFCTGSDRVPINGLASLTFVISRNGPDSDRLPTAHTCFNHLLLPDYKSRSKLKDRLLLSVNQAEGFGLM